MKIRGRGLSVFLVHMRCVFLTDISLVSTMTIWRVSKKTRSCVGAHVQSYKCVSLARSTHFKLEILLHIMVNVVDSSKKLIEDTSCLQCLTHFETFRDKQVTLSFKESEIAVVPPQEHCTVMRFRRKSTIIDHISKSTTCSYEDFVLQ